MSVRFMDSTHQGAFHVTAHGREYANLIVLQAKAPVTLCRHAPSHLEFRIGLGFQLHYGALQILLKSRHSGGDMKIKM